MWKYCRRSFIWKIKPQDFINRLNWKLEQPFIDSIIHSRSEWGGGGRGVTTNQAHTVKTRYKEPAFCQVILNRFLYKCSLAQIRPFRFLNN